MAMPTAEQNEEMISCAIIKIMSFNIIHPVVWWGRGGVEYSALFCVQIGGDCDYSFLMVVYLIPTHRTLLFVGTYCSNC
jgi:hypothetical protein